MPPSIFCPDTTWTGTQILLSEQHCEQQRAYIAAQQMQAAAAQSAAFSASMNQMNQALQQQNNNTLQQINQMNQQLQNQNNQMMESWAPQQNKTTICNRIGNQVFCR